MTVPYDLGACFGLGVLNDLGELDELNLLCAHLELDDQEVGEQHGID